MDTQYLDMPHNDAEFYGTEYPVYYYYKSTMYVPDENDSMKSPRADAKVLSMLYYSYWDTGGVHGYGEFTGVCFDVESGELLSFETIANDYKAFSDVVLSYIIDGIKEFHEENLTGIDEIEGYEDTVQYMYEENHDNWYMSDDGFVFLYCSGEISGYAGEIIVEVPYSKIAEYMNAEYIKDSE